MIIATSPAMLSAVSMSAPTPRGRVADSGGAARSGASLESGYGS